MHTHGFAHRCTFTHTHLPTTTMHRSLHMPSTHMHKLVYTCVGGPDPGGDPPDWSLWPGSGPEPDGDSTQALCPSGSELPMRGFTGHLQGHNPLHGHAPDLILPGVPNNGPFFQQRRVLAWPVWFLGVGSGLAPLISLPSECGV